jgi:hypothetical protein
MNYIENIQKALDSALKDFGFDNGIIIALEDIDAPTDTSTPYLASFQINTGATVSDLDTTDIRNGFYQIDINVTSGSGSSAINKLADQLNGIFFPGAYFNFNGTCVGIDDVVPSRVIVGGGWSKMALTINWNSYTSRIK